MTSMEHIMAPVSVGDLADKITVLQIKLEHIPDEKKRLNVETELNLLMDVFVSSVPQTDEMKEALTKLKAVNEEIWDLSDKIHECERKNVCTEEDVVFYRVIHTRNDERFGIKKQINALANSKIAEEKSYEGH